MSWTTMRAVALVIVLSAGSVRAAEPLLGRWLLARQAIGGQDTEVNELTLRISAAGPAIEFAYSVPVNNIQFVSLRFTARPDGTEADVTNANGKKVGTVKVTKSGASRYSIVLQGQNKPSASGTMTVSADGKTLTSESQSKQPGQPGITRMVQVFSRQ